jgi:hypothetical protein
MEEIQYFNGLDSNFHFAINNPTECLMSQSWFCVHPHLDKILYACI